MRIANKIFQNCLALKEMTVMILQTEVFSTLMSLFNFLIISNIKVVSDSLRCYTFDLGRSCLPPSNKSSFPVIGSLNKFPPRPPSLQV